MSSVGIVGINSCANLNILSTRLSGFSMLIIVVYRAFESKHWLSASVSVLRVFALIIFGTPAFRPPVFFVPFWRPLPFPGSSDAFFFISKVDLCKNIHFMNMTLRKYAKTALFHGLMFGIFA